MRGGWAVVCGLLACDPGLGPALDPACVVFVGDVAPGRDSRLIGPDTPWDDWPGTQRDRWVGNLEGTVAVGDCQQGDPRLCLGFGAERLALLGPRPFGALSVENNHSLDHGSQGRAATVAGLEALGVLALQAGEPAGLQVGPADWSLVVVDLSQGTAARLQTRAERALADIARAANSTRWVAVLPHWGNELEPRPGPGQAAWAARFRAWGATHVFGHGAHVVQPQSCDAAGGTWMGLGNHLMDQQIPGTWTGQVVRCCPDDGGTMHCRTGLSARTGEHPWPQPQPKAAIRPCATPPPPAPDLGWQVHAQADRFESVAPLPAAGAQHYLAVWRQHSDFDGSTAPRPYVFRVEADGRTVDVWRGTSLSTPLVAATVRQDAQGSVLCALQRADGFLAPAPESLERMRQAYVWNGFGFDGASGRWDPACSGL